MEASSDNYEAVMSPQERSEEEEEEDTESLGGAEPEETPLPVAGRGENGAGSGSEEGETSDSASSNTSTTTSAASSSSSEALARSGSGSPQHGARLMEADEYGEHMHVSCAGNAAKFYLNRFARGSIGRCVLFKGRWVTPNEFQAISGRQSSKDWKRSIRLRGRCLKEYIAKGLFQEHQKTCVCSVCSGEAAEHLRQEGEMALAAKRRRLSQADVGGTGSHTPETPVVIDAQPSSSHSVPRVGTKRRRGRGGKIQRVWSPSGEVAQEISGEEVEMEEEEEEGEGEGEGEEEEEEEEEENKEQPILTPSPVAEPPLYVPRRSQRSAHRRCGYRTELGTYTRKPREWDLEEVSEFLRMHGFGEHAEVFQEGQMDGESMFLLKEHHLTENFGMKLGPALKLLDLIGRLRHPPVA